MADTKQKGVMTEEMVELHQVPVKPDPTQSTSSQRVYYMYPNPFMPHSTNSTSSQPVYYYYTDPFTPRSIEQQDGVTKNAEQMVEMPQLPITSNSAASASNSNNLEQIENDIINGIQTRVLNCPLDHLSSKCCIYWVPQAIRDLKGDAYTPRIVSIGPFHYGNVKLRDMECRKHMFFKRFTREATTSLSNLIKVAVNLEPRVRSSYSDINKFSRKDFAMMTLVDAGFIIELFKENYSKCQLITGKKLSQPWFMDGVRKDLILLENQLPFFFLEEVFNTAFPPDNRGIPSFLALTCEFFHYFNIQKLTLDPDVKILHFIDLLRLFHLREKKPRRCSYINARTDHLLYSANELQEAGVKFKPSQRKCLLDLSFTGPILEVPQILVDDLTEVLIRNMIALEKCHYPFECYITDYALLLDCLININKDVDVLIHTDIICNRNLADTDDVAKVLNGLCKNVVQEDFNSNYHNICRKLNEFYQNPWHKKKATLRRDYCSTPWQTVASFAGIILLILTIVQTICSILQVV